MKPRKDAKNTEVNNNVKKEAVSYINIQISNNFEFEDKSRRCDDSQHRYIIGL